MAAPDTLDLGPSGGSLLRCSERHWLPREASASCTTQDNDCPRALRSTLERMAALEKIWLKPPHFFASAEHSWVVCVACELWER